MDKRRKLLVAPKCVVLWNGVKYAFAGLFIIAAAQIQSAQSQWKEVAHHLVAPLREYVGTISFHDRVAWVGMYSLYYSKDSGTTWNPVPSFAPITPKGDPGFTITAIAIYDSLNVLIGTGDDGLVLTSDGGRTWTQIFVTSSFNVQPFMEQVAFNGSALNLLALAGSMYSSTDRGVTWNQGISRAGYGPLCFAIATDKTIYAETLDFGGKIDASTDGGKNWAFIASLAEGDCETISADSCDARRLYLANENTVMRSDNLSRIDMTTDAGATWRSIISHPLDYFNGSLSATRQVIYAGTVPEARSGVERSIDGGVSWQNIGGPSECYDTRTIAAIDNNTVLVLDSEGSVWRTFNSGGDSLVLPGAWLAIASQPAPVEQATCQISSSAIPIGVIGYGCSVPSGMLDSAWITGSAAFRMADTRLFPRPLSSFDSIMVAYVPSSAPDSAILHIEYNLGSGLQDTTISIIGVFASSFAAAPVVIHRELASGYMGDSVALNLDVNVSSTINFDSIWPYITDFHGVISWDSSVLKYVSYQSLVWDIISLGNFGNSLQFAIHNYSASSGNAVNPISLGTATFQLISGKPATSLVHLSQLSATIADRINPLCVRENEDNHWAVQTLVPSSVARNNPNEETSVVLYPNPSGDRAWISSNDDLGVSTIIVYDVLGVERNEMRVNIQKNNPVVVNLPNADGVYNLLIRSLSGTISKNIIRIH